MTIGLLSSSKPSSDEANKLYRLAKDFFEQTCIELSINIDSIFSKGDNK